MDLVKLYNECEERLAGGGNLFHFDLFAAAIRKEALEEAARVCDEIAKACWAEGSGRNAGSYECAAAEIRALSDPPNLKRPDETTWIVKGTGLS